jgi:eukaryotic-like serine/threonine-protein kinase
MRLSSQQVPTSQGEGMHNVPTDFPKGNIIQERYIIEDMLGKGGAGAVYLVRDLRVQTNVFALKEVVGADRQERYRFAFECELLKRLDHRALPRVYGVFEDDRWARAYLLMDFIDGPNLELLRQQQPQKRFSFPQVMSILAPVFDAVSYLHEQHPPIIHMDIKPANIIVPRDDDEAVLVDFGIAKEYDQDATTMAVRRCSPGYGAPEQYAQGTNTRTDIYGLGATIYTLLTGVVPPDAFARVTQLGKKQADPLRSVTQLAPHIPMPVAMTVERAMAIDSDDRFATIRQFLQELKSHRDGEPSPASAPAANEMRFVAPDTAAFPREILSGLKNLTRRRRTFILPLAILAVFVLLAGMIFGSAFMLTAGNVVHFTPTATSIPRKIATRADTTTKPKVIPTTKPAHYPMLVGFYKGTIRDQYTTPSTNSTLSLIRIRQIGARISGYFSVGPGLIGNGNFTGTVSFDNTVQFLVQGYAGLLPLSFQGQVHPDRSISGTYCSYNTLKNQCDYSSGGYGNWTVSP